MAALNKKSAIRILHVDDDPLVLETSKLILMDMDNFEIDNACCVDEALKKLFTRQYDVVVSDYEMPQKDGLQFLKELRERNIQIPFILFTGKGREEVAIKALNLGADGYHNKQGSPETIYGELFHSIRSCVEHQKAKQNLIKTETKYSYLFSNMLNGFAHCKMIYDKENKPVDFVYIEVNDAFTKLTGLKKEAVIGKKVTEAIPGIEKTNPEVFEIYGRVALTGKEEQFELFFSPIKIWLSITAYSPEKGYFIALFDNITERKKAEEKLSGTLEVLERVGEGLDAGLAVIDKDYRVIWANKHLMDLGVSPKKNCYQTFITEQKETEERLKQAEEKHRTLLNAANVIVQSVDAEGRYVFVNEEWKQVLGYTDKDIERITIMNVIRKDHLQYCMNVFKQVMNGVCIRNVETIFVAKDGKEIVVSGNACPIFKDGKFVSTVAFFVDITERKKTEEKLRESGRRIEMMNEKLRVVGSLTRHDVRNKLSAVTGYAYILKKKHSDLADVVDGLSKMEQAVAETVKIFDFAKMYEQIGVEELTYVNVEEKLKEAVALFSGPIPTIKNECQGLTVLADSFLRQLFYNFIDNTRKYGEKTTTIRVHYEKMEEDGLKLVYEDDGVGISFENKPSLFKEGFSTGGSTGFGLFLTKRMIDVYSWRIEENGEPGKGAKFTITIPKLNKNGEENYLI